jgi:hypothetical protein
LRHVVQLVFEHHAFDERKQLALLQAHVGGQLVADEREHAGVRGRCGGQRVRAVADDGVLAERSQNDRIVWVAVAGVGKEEDFLLKPECRRPCRDQ